MGIIKLLVCLLGLTHAALFTQHAYAQKTMVLHDKSEPILQKREKQRGPRNPSLRWLRVMDGFDCRSLVVLSNATEIEPYAYCEDKPYLVYKYTTILNYRGVPVQIGGAVRLADDIIKSVILYELANNLQHYNKKKKCDDSHGEAFKCGFNAVASFPFKLLGAVLSLGAYDPFPYVEEESGFINSYFSERILEVMKALAPHFNEDHKDFVWADIGTKCFKDGVCDGEFGTNARGSCVHADAKKYFLEATEQLRQDEKFLKEAIESPFFDVVGLNKAGLSTLSKLDRQLEDENAKLTPQQKFENCMRKAQPYIDKGGDVEWVKQQCKMTPGKILAGVGAITIPAAVATVNPAAGIIVGVGVGLFYITFKWTF